MKTIPTIVRSRPLPLLIALFLCALALRPQLVGAGPLFALIERDLGISHALIGLLGTIPVLCMGVFAPIAPALRRRLGTAAAVSVSLGLISVFGLTRLAGAGAARLIVLTIGVGAGMGLGGALLPVIIKEHLPRRAVTATAVYSTGIQLGSVLSASAAVPLALHFGSWRASLLAFSLITVVVAGLWWLLTRRLSTMRTAVRPPAFAFGNPVAWRLAVAFALFGVVYYGLIAWLSSAYVERGWTLSAAGSLVGVLNAGGLIGSTLLALFGSRVSSRPRTAALLAAGLLLAAAGIAAVPSLAFLWVAIGGLANGALLPVLLAMPLHSSEGADAVAAIAAVMLGVGYTAAALAPVGLGAVRDITGTFTLPLWIIAAVAAGLFVSCLSFDGATHRG